MMTSSPIISQITDLIKYLGRSLHPYIEIVDETLPLTRSHQRKGTKKVNFEKTTNIAPANNRIQTSETNSYT